MMLVWGVMCALTHANKTGEGQVVDAAITDGSAYISSLLMMLKNTGMLQDEFGMGWADGAAPWNETYKCADGGFVNICALEPKFYKELLERLGLTENPIFKNQWGMKNWPQGKAELTEIFAGKTRDEWCELLEGTDVCFAPVLNFSEAAQHPHNVARGTFMEIDGVLQPAPAPKFSRSQPSVGVPPGVGANTDELLRAAGLDEEIIAELKARGAV